MDICPLSCIFPRIEAPEAKRAKLLKLMLLPAVPKSPTDNVLATRANERMLKLEAKLPVAITDSL
jgi:hypothetical protein